MNIFSRSLVALILLTALTVQGEAAEPDVTIRLRPHCTETSVTCAAFALYDEQTSITNSLTPGMILDLDIVLSNPSGQPIQSIQSWLEYNPLILQGSEVRISSDFPLVAPGEQTFVEEQGIVRLGASNVSGGMNAQEFVFARVQFEILSAVENLIPLRFHEFSLLGQEGRTKALVIEGGRTVNVLKTYPRNLFLYFGEDPPPSISPAVPQPPTQIPPTTIPPTGQPPAVQPPVTVPNALRNLQPQGVRITTEGDHVYLLWSPLTDPRIAGYNIYYGTVPGRYIQRRTVSSGTDGVTIRNLPLGQQYYFALTAYDARGNESDFSYEVAVIVGDPSSSTAPFTLSAGGTPLQGSVITGGRGKVPGGTGMPLGVVVGIAFIALLSSAYFLRLRKNHSRS